ncbi:MAG: substrate-binding domain-containing protein [Myxococcales bacterium]|nr:substrate-binding domain-containing protein [Myxococcales bacterium]
MVAPRLRRLGAVAAALAVSALAGPPAAAEGRFITVASTTSTRDSGLFDWILPRFTRKTGIEVRIVAVGTGRALRLGERGDVDAVLVHDRSAEEAFVAAGFGIERREVMSNFFVVIGPEADPAGVRHRRDAPAALARVAETGSLFTSRGDDSGTHKAELRLWRSAGIDPRPHSGRWYRETGTGMGATLNTAAELGAYALTDSGTWGSFKNRRDLTVLMASGEALRNPYGAIVVNPERHPHVKQRWAQRFVDWLASPEGRAAIASFRVDGESLFYPASDTSTD